MKLGKIFLFATAFSSLLVGSSVVDDKRSYQFFIKTQIVNSDDSYSNSNLQPFEIINDPLYMGSVGVKLFPDTLNITLSYTATVQEDLFGTNTNTDDFNRNSSSDDVSYIDIFIKPFQGGYGSIGFGYQNYKYNTRFRNITNHILYIDDIENDGQNSSNTDEWFGDTLALNPNDVYTVQNQYERLYISYTVPKDSKFPEYFTTKFSYFKGDRPQQMGSYDINANAQYDGLFGLSFGISKVDDELHYGFNIKTLELLLYSVPQTYIVWDNGVKKEVSGDMTYDPIGINIETVYKTKSGLFVNFGLDYQYEEVDSWDSQTQQDQSIGHTMIKTTFGIGIIF